MFAGSIFVPVDLFPMQNLMLTAIGTWHPVPTLVAFFPGRINPAQVCENRCEMHSKQKKCPGKSRGIIVCLVF